MRAVLLVVLTACHGTTSSTLASRAAPPPAAPTLSLAGDPALVLHGETVVLQLRQAPPSARAAIARGGAPGSGPAWCPPILQGACADLTDPAFILRVGTVPAAGALDLTLTVPATAAPEVWFQAVVGDATGRTLSAPLRLRTASPSDDTDLDGLTNAEERALGTDPTTQDTDNDGLPDTWEVELYDTDPLRPDTDDDGLLDGFEADTWEFCTMGIFQPPYSDGYWDFSVMEYPECTGSILPTHPDVDGDGLLDGADPFPLSADGDGDGLPDRDELTHTTDPRLADTDGDGLTDGEEVRRLTDPLHPDTDADGLADGLELRLRLDPRAADTDADGLADGAELRMHHTLPDLADSDGGGRPDGEEITAGTDPAWPTDDGRGVVGDPLPLAPTIRLSEVFHDPYCPGNQGLGGCGPGYGSAADATFLEIDNTGLLPWLPDADDAIEVQLWDGAVAHEASRPLTDLVALDGTAAHALWATQPYHREILDHLCLYPSYGCYNTPEAAPCSADACAANLPGLGTWKLGAVRLIRDGAVIDAWGTWGTAPTGTPWDADPIEQDHRWARLPGTPPNAIPDAATWARNTGAPTPGTP